MTRATRPAWTPLRRFQLVGAGGEPVDFVRSLASHGVATLPPQLVGDDPASLETTLEARPGSARTIRVKRAGSGSVVLEALGRPGAAEAAALATRARRMLGLDEDLSAFYGLAAGDDALAWVCRGAGRMLRGPSVFEDVVKTICTTNCAWSSTVRMVTALVEGLGRVAPGGRRAFPSPAAMAAADEAFYRETVRAGYRGPYLMRLAGEVASGRLDLEELANEDLPDHEVHRRLLALPGVGPYGAAHIMLTSLGRYRELVLDSWTRPTYGRLSGKAATDRAIRRRFARYGRYAGLAFWLFVTRHWVDE